MLPGLLLLLLEQGEQGDEGEETQRLGEREMNSEWSNDPGETRPGQPSLANIKRRGRESWNI